jgi:hypothetical protein
MPVRRLTCLTLPLLPGGCAGDTSLNVREAAARGLGLGPAQRQQGSAAADGQLPGSWPAPEVLLDYVVARHPQLVKAADPGQPLHLPAQ